jgi:hypothetical protein
MYNINMKLRKPEPLSPNRYLIEGEIYRLKGGMMKDFGKQSAFIVVRQMVEFAVKRAGEAMKADGNIKIDVSETARKFCRGEIIPFESGREKVEDSVGENILCACEYAQEISYAGMDVMRIVGAAKEKVKEALTDILLRASYRGTGIPVRVRLPFLQAFDNLLQYKFLGGGD